jgi:hypothetical protein
VGRKDQFEFNFMSNKWTILQVCYEIFRYFEPTQFSIPKLIIQLIKKVKAILFLTYQKKYLLIKLLLVYVNN